MDTEAGLQLLAPGSRFASPGGHFVFTAIGPICRLYDREELPWPSSSLVWRGKQPYWNRQGVRFVADLATARFPSYRVRGTDGTGHRWEEDRTLYGENLSPELRQWWITRKPQANSWPELPASALAPTESTDE